MRRLIYIIWKNKFKSTTSKAHIYKTAVRPILTCAAETRTDTRKIKNLLIRTEIKTLTSIMDVTLSDRKRSSDLRNECDEVTDIVRWVRGRRREWKAQVERISLNRPVGIIYREKPDTRRAIDRPPKHWTESWTSTSQEQ